MRLTEHQTALTNPHVELETKECRLPTPGYQPLSPSGLEPPTLPELLTLLGFALVVEIPAGLKVPAGLTAGLTAVLEPVVPVTFVAEGGFALAAMVVFFACEGLTGLGVPAGTVFFTGAPAIFF